MNDIKYKFISEVLGDEGSKALQKAAARSNELGNALLPRTILAWLGISARGDYEGDVPGVENTYLRFSKSEDKYTGSVSVGEDLYSFDQVSVFHLASAIAVALGADHERIPANLKHMDLVSLGKNIDTLVKARIAIAELRKMRVEPLEKAISAIKLGTPAPSGKFDYSHVLQPAHKKAGYSVHVSHNPESGTMTAHLRHGAALVGEAKAFAGKTNMEIEDAEIAEPHQGKGLGTHMYEALMAHGYHKLGVKGVQGSIHSSMASRVHQKLSSKHGMEYKQTPTPSPQLASPTPGPYDARHGPYSYAIKQEEDMSKTAHDPHDRAETPGPAHAPTQAMEPLAPTAPDPSQSLKGPTVGLRPSNKIKLPKPPTPKKQLQVLKSQILTRCPVCDQAQFKGGKFNGCLCFRELSKSVRVIETESGYTLEFNSNWDEDSILTLAESMVK